MNAKLKWLLITSEQDYAVATVRYEEIKHATKGFNQHKEKLLLVNVISKYEKAQWDLMEVSLEEFIKILQEDFGYNLY